MSLFERAKKARENKKGFTLVELIVVLVILAILAAIMVPQLLGYIDKAKEKQLTVTGRMILLAGQSAASEAYAGTGEAKKITVTAINKYLGSDVTAGNWAIKFTEHKVDQVQYSDGADSITYTPAGGWVKDSTANTDVVSSSSAVTETNEQGTGTVGTEVSGS